LNTERNHLDAETVAAWLDGGLDAVSLAAAEAHASNCERCQALLATVAKTLPEGEPSLVVSGFSRIKWWLAPLVAAAAAVTVWMVVPQEQAQQIAARAPQAETDTPSPAGARARDEAAPKAIAIEPPPAAKPPQPQPAEERFGEVKRQADAPATSSRESQFAQEKLGAETANVAGAAAAKDRQDAKAEESRLARAEAEPARTAVSAPAAPAPVAAPAEVGALRENAPVTQLRKQVAALEFVSPDPQRRWRVTSNGIERSEDGGRTWMPVRLAQGETITAGASPAPLVLWLVGRRGLVLLATDGTNFTRLPFPEAVDLTAVSSPDFRTAVVTTVDGRIFRTENAGRIWTRQ
jgi:hypothetical protein